MDGDCRNATSGPTRVTGPTRAKEHVRLGRARELASVLHLPSKGGGGGEVWGEVRGKRERERGKGSVYHRRLLVLFLGFTSTL
jgi:hypothetical protein